MASIIAIDFGNENCLVSVPKRGGVDIISNQASQRLTPTMLAYSDTRRYSGIFAQQQQMQNLANTLTQLKRLVGLKYDSPEREEIEKIAQYNLVPNENGYVAIKVNYLNKETVLEIEQCLSFLIKGLFNIANLNKTYADQCVVVVSPWWNEMQRRVIFDSARIAGYKVAKLLNSTSAEAITYQMYHRKVLPPSETKNVAFIDFGDACLNVAIVQYHDGMLEVKGYCCDDHMGGSNFTTALVNYLLKIVKDKYKIDPTTNGRASIRFRTAAEKLKKGLSINPVMPFEVQSLMNDIDINFLVKRTEFEEQIKDLIPRIAAPIEKALELAKVQAQNLFAIEVHGGASRVPAVKAKIKEIFGADPTQSLNPDECFALGGGFQAALLSPQFRLDLKVKDVFQHSVNVRYVDTDGKQQDKEVFSQFQPIPCTKIVPVKVDKQLIVDVCSRNTKLGVIDIRTSKTDQIVSAKIRIRLTPDGIVDVQEVTQQQEQPIEIVESGNNSKEIEQTRDNESTEDNEAVNDSGESKDGGENNENHEIKNNDENDGFTNNDETKEGDGNTHNVTKENEFAKEIDAKESEATKENKGTTQTGETTEKNCRVPKKKVIEISVPFKYQPMFGLSDEKILEFQKIEQEMTNTDSLEDAIDTTKNNLESYIFQMENAIGRDFPDFFDPEKIEDYRAKIAEIHEWFSENEFDRFPLTEYQRRLDELKEFGETPLKRHKFRQMIPSIFQKIYDRGEKCKNFLWANEEQFKHISCEERNPLNDELTSFFKNVEFKENEIGKVPNHMEVPFKIDDLEDQIYRIEKKVNALMNTPSPEQLERERKQKEEEEAAKEAAKKAAKEAAKKKDKTNMNKLDSDNRDNSAENGEVKE